MPDKALKNCFLVFSDDFGEHPSSCQHLFHHISKTHSVLWVNTIGMRAPTLTKRDVVKAIKKIGNMLSSLTLGRKNQDAIDDITVCQPIMLPFSRLPAIRTFNRYSVVNHVRKKLNALKMSAPIMVVTAPNACDYVNKFDERCVVYYCVDDFSEWPGLDRKLVKEMENQLIDESDILIATSRNLCEKIERRGKQANLLTHGVDINFFSTPRLDEHILITDIPKPRVGYFGLFDDRSDKNLLMEIARLLPEISFVITGNTETDISRLQNFENIYFTGSVPYTELPQLADGFDICILPYKINKLTNAIQPLKFKEYLATGKPIISTPIQEAVGLKEYIDIAETATQWSELIQRNLGGLSQSMKEKRALFIKNHSWEHKTEQFLHFILDNDTCSK